MNIDHMCNINENTLILSRFVHWMCERGVIGVQMLLCGSDKRFSGELV